MGSGGLKAARTRGRTLAVIAGLAALLGVGGPSVAGGAPARTAASCPGTAAGSVRNGPFGGIVRPAHGRGCASGFSDPATGTPPLIFHGGAMMSTRSTHDQVVITPIFWQGSGAQGYSFPSGYVNLLNRYLRDAAADSEKPTNIFSTLFEYDGTTGTINYRFKLGSPITDTDAFPAAGCITNLGPVYADGSGYTTCMSDPQVRTEVDAVVSAQGLPRDLGHLYVMYLPKHVESCFQNGLATQCTINPSPSAAYCAYHSQVPTTGTVYANMPFPIYPSVAGAGITCAMDAAGLGYQSPNSNLDADVEISPLSHEISEAVTDPDVNTGWYDSKGFENGDECAYTYGALSGASGARYNQTLNGHHYLTQEEFSNRDWRATAHGCVQQLVPTVAKVKKVSPATGTTAGGTSVTISGTGFAGATSVTFGGTSAAFKLTDDGRIKATAPAHAAGTVDVRVVTAAGTSSIVAADHFTYS